MRFSGRYVRWALLFWGTAYMFSVFLFMGFTPSSGIGSGSGRAGEAIVRPRWLNVQKVSHISGQRMEMKPLRNIAELVDDRFLVPIIAGRREIKAEKPETQSSALDKILQRERIANSLVKKFHEKIKIDEKKDTKDLKMESSAAISDKSLQLKDQKSTGEKNHKIQQDLKKISFDEKKEEKNLETGGKIADKILVSEKNSTVQNHIVADFEKPHSEKQKQNSTLGKFIEKKAHTDSNRDQSRNIDHTRHVPIEKPKLASPNIIKQNSDAQIQSNSKHSIHNRTEKAVE
jgi:hypothetical protein